VPKNVPIIFVSNHQSMYDIINDLVLRRFHCKFVSKKELGQGIPSISFNLRHGGSALIDRKDRNRRFLLLRVRGVIEKHHRSAVIFQKEPE
jgi:1-acyl-sn-glycerol-3-phosphate acyltransferase